MGTHLRVLSESSPMNTNMTGLRWFFINLCVFVLWTKVASALEGLKPNTCKRTLENGDTQIIKKYLMIKQGLLV